MHYILNMWNMIVSELASLALNVSASLDSKDVVSICTKPKFKSLKHRWLCQPDGNKSPAGGRINKI